MNIDKKTKAALYTVLAVIALFLCIFLTIVTKGLFAVLMFCGLIVTGIYFVILDILEG